MRLVDYYFGRINFIAHVPNKRDFILNGLKTDAFVDYRSYSWGFFNINELESDIGSVVCGTLIKHEPLGEETIAELETHSIKPTKLPNKVVAQSIFFIHIETSLIAYHPTRDISNSQFYRNFEKIFEKAYGTLVNVEIQSIDEPMKFIEEIERFKKIDKIEMYLHPSNPDSRNYWKKVMVVR